jgi:hypothetical protein
MMTNQITYLPSTGSPSHLPTIPVTPPPLHVLLVASMQYSPTKETDCFPNTGDLFMKRSRVE